VAQTDSAASGRAASPGSGGVAVEQRRCVHCGARLPASAARCERCFDLQPLCFAAGPSHVEILELRRPRRVLRWLQGRHLSGCDGRTLAVIARQLAAVCLGPVRVLSFVDRRQAEGLAQSLEAAGAHCRVVDEPVWPWGVIALFLLVLLAVTATLDRAGSYVAAYLLYFLSEPLLSFLRARQSLLSTSRWPRSTWPGLQLRAALLALILACISNSLLARSLERVTFDGAFAALTAGLAALALAASVLGAGWARLARSPEPPWPAQLCAAVQWGGGWQRGQPLHAARARPPAPGLPHALALTLTIALVPLETALLLRGGEGLGPARQLEATADSSTVTSELAPAAGFPLILERAQARALLGAAPTLVLLVLAGGLLRRARAVRQQGQRLVAALQAPAAQGQRLLPWSVLLPRAPDLVLAQAWLQTASPSARPPRLRTLRARLRQWPATVLCDAPFALAQQLVVDGQRHGLPLRAIYGWHSIAPRRLRDASALELAGAALLHATAVLGLGALLLSAGASPQHLVLLPPLAFLLGLMLLRGLPRRSLLRLRRPPRQDAARV
jgi:hypothetical protein